MAGSAIAYIEPFSEVYQLFSSALNPTLFRIKLSPVAFSPCAESMSQRQEVPIAMKEIAIGYK